MSTVAYYMLEFRNDVDYQFLQKFQNFGSDGFTNVRPAEFIESMVLKSKQNISVIMNPPKMYFRDLNPARQPFARLQYTHAIEPRKIAHQIVTVRDDITKELLTDLNCIKLEHDEAIRYCLVALTEGKEHAEKTRKFYTFQSPTGSTPLRKKSYYECSLLVRAYICPHLLSLADRILFFFTLTLAPFPNAMLDYNSGFGSRPKRTFDIQKYCRNSLH